jgi:hypothetical protein
MLIPMGIILGAGIMFLVSALRRAYLRQQCEEVANDYEPEPAPPPEGMGLSLFEQPCRWLAIKGEHLSAVQAALNLNHVTSCSWEEGLVEAQEDKLFISPPISGWILVMGSGLPDPGEDVDRCFHFLTNLSRKLGEVQFFNANRVLNYHAWVLMEKGHVYRAYAWADGTVWNQGPMTPAERELDVQCFDYGVELVFTQREALAANVEKVNQVAARWSIDPSAIPDASYKASNGLVGELSHSKLH